MKKISTMLLALLIITTMVVSLSGCSCGGAGGYVGSWYNAYDLDDDPLILTGDGTFSVDGIGGEYTIEGDQLILTTSLLSEVLEISEADGETCLIDDDGEMWFKGKETAEEYANSVFEEAAAEALAEAKKSGEFIGIYENDNDYKCDYYLLELSEDNTYLYGYKKHITYNSIESQSAEAAQAGTWKLTAKGSMDNIYIYIELTPTESEGFDQFRDDSWIDNNELPTGLHGLRFSADDFNGVLYSTDAVDNRWEKVA
ncbi:MAG: hypothetical protein J6L81_01960 [Clostridia bacterium]|nr:hypothetical protein [Clostridia bacterium]